MFVNPPKKQKRPTKKSQVHTSLSMSVWTIAYGQHCTKSRDAAPFKNRGAGIINVMVGIGLTAKNWMGQ